MGPCIRAVFYTPRFSYRCLKVAVRASWLVLVSGDMRVVRAGWVLRVGIPGGYQGGLYRGVLPSHPAARGAHPDSEAGPVGSCRGWSGVVRVGGRTGTAGMLPDHPCGARSVPTGPPCLGPCFPASQPIGMRFDLISYKVSQNRGVSPKYV